MEVIEAQQSPICYDNSNIPYSYVLYWFNWYFKVAHKYLIEWSQEIMSATSKEKSLQIELAKHTFRYMLGIIIILKNQTCKI